VEEHFAYEPWQCAGSTLWTGPLAAADLLDEIEAVGFGAEE
jgi:hypothetical protein